MIESLRRPFAAQGHQESQLNQNAKSPVDAIGIMQLTPATGNELEVGDIRQAKINSHAGTKYMDIPMTRFNNVEIVTAEKIGMETTTCVRNIFKYSAAYRLLADAAAFAETSKQEVAPKKKQ